MITVALMADTGMTLRVHMAKVPPSAALNGASWICGHIMAQRTEQPRVHSEQWHQIMQTES